MEIEIKGIDKAPLSASKCTAGDMFVTADGGVYVSLGLSPLGDGHLEVVVVRSRMGGRRGIRVQLNRETVALLRRVKSVELTVE